MRISDWSSDVCSSDLDHVDRGDVAAVGAPDHLAVAREAVAKSLVLLKNNGGLLPIKPGAKLHVAGPGADNMAMQAGGWTLSWQGTDATPDDFPNGPTTWEGLNTAAEAAGSGAILSAAGGSPTNPDTP